MPPLSSLRVFEAAARHGSFRDAGAELGMTGSAVSHAVDALEKAIGVELFLRGPRGVSLTSAGTDYLPYISEALSLIAAGLSHITLSERDAQVRVRAEPDFTRLFLLPRIHLFRERHPQIQVSIASSSEPTEAATEDFDLAIRHGKGSWPQASATLLFKECLVPVASESYLRSVRTPGGLLDWSRVTFIHTSAFPSDWRTWAEGTGQSLEFRQDAAFDKLQLAVRAAATGLGIAMGRVPLSLLSTSTGHAPVQPAHPARVSIEEGYWLLETAEGTRRRAAQTFREWLLDVSSSERASSETCGRIAAP
ncbi:LysR substrate-binding domain-containing protein [Bradyrhizobium sp. USDA 4461]